MDALQEELDMFLRELGEVTGQITNLEITNQNDEIIVLVIYNCWKRI